MTTISNSITFNSNLTFEDVGKTIQNDIQKELQARGVEETFSPDKLALTTVANEDGSFTITYKYSLSLDKPDDIPEGGYQRAADALGNGNQDAFVDLGQILALFHQVTEEQRSAAQEGRQAQLRFQVAELKNSAQEIRNSAVAAFVGAVVMGAISIAGGLATVAGSVRGGIDAKKGLDASKQATQLSDELKLASQDLKALKLQNNPSPLEKQQLSELQGQVKKLQTDVSGLNQQSQSFNNQSQMTLSKWQGWSSLGQGFGGIGKGIADYVSTQDQADSKEAEAMAAQAGAQRDELIDYQSRMQQTEADIRQLLQQISQNQLETARAIFRA